MRLFLLIILIIAKVGVKRISSKENWGYEAAIAAIMAATPEGRRVTAEIAADCGQVDVVESQSGHCVSVTEILQICKPIGAGKDSSAGRNLDHGGLAGGSCARSNERS